MMTEFEFDPEKSAANLVKHGVGLEFGERVFADPAISIIPTVRIGVRKSARRQ